MDEQTAHAVASDDGMPEAPKRGRPRKVAVAMDQIKEDVAEVKKAVAVTVDDFATLAVEVMHEVSLKGLKPLRVMAKSAAEAWDKFKKANGIIDSDHKPSINVVPPDDGTL